MRYPPCHACTRCDRWVHRHCGSDVSTLLAHGSINRFQCNKCAGIVAGIRQCRKAWEHPEEAQLIAAVCATCCARAIGGRYSAEAAHCPLCHRLCHAQCLSTRWRAGTGLSNQLPLSPLCQICIGRGVMPTDGNITRAIRARSRALRPASTIDGFINRIRCGSCGVMSAVFSCHRVFDMYKTMP